MMIVPVLLFLMSAAASVWAFVQAGAVNDLCYLATLSTLAAAVLTLRIAAQRRRVEKHRRKSYGRRLERARGAAERARSTYDRARPVAPPIAEKPRKQKLRPGRGQIDIAGAVVIDGSNVLFWDRNVPALESVRAVLREVESMGLTPLVGFDANVGYQVGDRYLNGPDLAMMLGLNPDQVAVAPKGQPADPLLIDAALRLGGRVVTNDRYRDWAEAHPEVTRPGFLIPGRLVNGLPELSIGQGMAQAA